MEVIVGKNSGFCAGVKNTVSKAEEELAKNPYGLDCLGEIVHNKQVIQNLNKKGLRIIDNIENATSKVIIRAHGTTKQVYDYADKHGISLIDLTCPKVLKIHEQVQKFANDNYFIFLLGSKNHPEIIGTYSFCGQHVYLIEDLSDIESAIESLKNSNLKKVLIISQTTFSINLFDDITSSILEKLGTDFDIHTQKSICGATNIRQLEVTEISSKVDLMIIIGGKNSSNTKKLYEIAIKNCNTVLQVQTKEELDLSFIKNFNKIGIIAGASTPNYIIDEVEALCRLL